MKFSGDSALRHKAAVLLLAVTFAACGRTEEKGEGDAYKALLAREREMRTSLQQQHASIPEDEIAVQLVQAYDAPDGNGAVTQWVERTLGEFSTSLFPRWVARKTAVGRYDVRFTCLVTDSSGAAFPIGYVWNADLALNVIRGPRAMSEEELRSEWKGRMRFPSPPVSEGALP